MSIYSETITDEYGGERSIVNGKKAEKIRKNPTKHYPNKAESTELRKIMSSTGLSEEEIRKDKKYRIRLSEAQKSSQKSKYTPQEKWCFMIAKKACRTTGLPREHPETIKILNELLQESSKRRGHFGRSRAWRYILMPTTAQKVFEYCKQYAKK